MTQIEVNGDYLELFDSEKIVASYQIGSFGDITARQSNYTNTFSIPLTAKNMEVLDCVQVLVNSTRVPYQKIPCKILVDGIAVVDGFASIVSVSDKIDLNVYSGNYDFFSLIKSKKLSDLDLSSYNHDWTSVNTIDRMATTSGVLYPLIDYHSDSPNSYLNNTDFEIDYRFMYFSFYLHTLISKIVSESGYSVSGSILDNIDYKSIFIPFSNDRLLKDIEGLDYKATSTSELAFNFNLTVAGFDEKKMIFNDTEGIGNHNKGLRWDVSLSRYIASQPTNIVFTVSAKDMYNEGSSFVNIRMKKNGVLVQTKQKVSGNSDIIFDSILLSTSDYIEFFAVPVLINNPQGTISSIANNGGNAEIILTATPPLPTSVGGFVYISTTTYTGNYEVLSISGNNVTIDTPFISTDTGTFYSYPNNETIISFKANETYSFSTIEEVLALGENIDVAYNMPDMTQGDLLKSFLQKFCCFASVDNTNKTIVLKQFSEIKDNIPNALNWSDKIDETNPHELKFELGKYSQINNLIYKVDDEVIKPIGTDYKLLVENQNLEEESVFIESLFGASEQVVRLSGLSIMQIKKAEAGVMFAKNTNQRLGIAEVITDGDFLDITDGVSVVGTTTSYTLSRFINYSQGFNLGWGNSLFLNYKEVISVLNEVKVLRLMLRLNIVDIYKLDFFTPIWIDKYACYFYISKINEYSINEFESTEVELIKLN